MVVLILYTGCSSSKPKRHFLKIKSFKIELHLWIKEHDMEHIQLYTKLNYLPTDLKSEVNDFIDFLLSKRKKENLLIHYYARKIRNDYIMKK